jgi:hypothetical protein
VIALLDRAIAPGEADAAIGTPLRAWRVVNDQWKLG